MNEDLLDYLVRMIRPLFPKNACIISGIFREDYIINVDWQLGNDLRHQNERSRKIKIRIPENAIQDYLDHKKEQGALYDSRIKTLIYQWYNVFNPHRDAGTTRFAPTENWLISRNLLNA
jgi:hypothetical protein